MNIIKIIMQKIKKELLARHIVKDNNFLNLYIELLIGCSQKNYTGHYVQEHHSIPVYTYRTSKSQTKKQLLKLADVDSLNLKISMLPSEHCLAHYYLCLCAYSEKDSFANFCAIKFIKDSFKINKITELEQISLEQLKAILPAYDTICAEQYKYLATKNKKLKSTLGRKWITNGIEQKLVSETDLADYINIGWSLGRLAVSTETKHKISNRLKTYFSEPDSRRGISSAQQNRIWVYNKILNIEKRILSDKLPEYQILGWELGRLPISDETLPHLRESHIGKPGNVKGRKKINNGIIMKTVPEEELPKYLSMGWILGELPKSQEWLKKIAIANKKKGKTK